MQLPSLDDALQPFSFGVCIRSCTVRVDIDLCVRVIGDEIRVFPLNVATEFANFKDRVTLYYRDLPVLVSWLGRRIQDEILENRLHAGSVSTAAFVAASHILCMNCGARVYPGSIIWGNGASC